MQMIGRRSGREDCGSALRPVGCSRYGLPASRSSIGSNIPFFLGLSFVSSISLLINDPCRLMSSWIPYGKIAMLTLSAPPIAPSISSMTTRLGFELPIFAPLSIAGRMRVSTMFPERSSLALVSKTEYPACCATICASVVLPRPGGPESSRS